jgi:hypothetical protein
MSLTAWLQRPPVGSPEREYRRALVEHIITKIDTIIARIPDK